ncbi:hypothetical protein EHS25_008441 [Saitozyma podzolica]|uniref:Uncharacterized protein n=1 Tax=Saitozyma podzolica TaxID=1890683 RepID=A0A427YPH4_9TREE|nr:hypothetical protein EHS25_008441 [Saitozyma podzolica]
MFRKISSAVTSVAGSLTGSPARQLPPNHHDPARAESYVELAKELQASGVPVSFDDCAACDHPCPPTEGSEGAGAGTIVEAGTIWEGKTYEQYVMDKYGDLGELPAGFDTDWESELAGSAKFGNGRVVVISTGKSDWERDHTDEVDGFAHKLEKYISKAAVKEEKGGKGAKDKGAKDKGGKQEVDFSKRPPVSSYVLPATLPPPSTDVTQATAAHSAGMGSLFSSSLISQSDDPEDQTVLVFPDWKVCLEVENSQSGAKGLWEGVLEPKLGRAGRLLAEEGGTERRRSWVLPYRAVILLCSHKRRDKRCSIAAPLLRSALVTVLSKHSINVDHTGSSLVALDGPALEEVAGGEAEREVEVGKRIAAIEGVHGGEGGEVGIFNINHLGGHRYAGVMLILFPSGAYLSYGRVTPQEIPRVVEETVLRGQIVPGLLRSAGSVQGNGKSLLNW